MPTWASLILSGLAGVAAIGLLAGVMMLAIGSPDDSDPRDPVPGREATPLRTVSRGAGIWPTSWSHDAPDRRLGVPDAHREMQVHRHCRLDGCARKAAAFQVLIEAGRVVPDTARQPY